MDNRPMYRHDEANVLKRAIRRSAGWKPLSLFYARTLHAIDRAVFRLSRGRTTFTAWLAGLPVAWLTTTGAKSGAERTAPVLAIPADDGKLVVIASNYGQGHNPSWYYNLRAHPQARVLFDGKRLRDGRPRARRRGARALVRARDRDLPGLGAVPEAGEPEDPRARAEPGRGRALAAAGAAAGRGAVLGVAHPVGRDGAAQVAVPAPAAAVHEEPVQPPAAAREAAGGLRCARSAPSPGGPCGGPGRRCRRGPRGRCSRSGRPIRPARPPRAGRRRAPPGGGR